MNLTILFRIAMAVRQWIAARVQARLQNIPRQRIVPRVDCPENPDQRRESIAAVFPELILEQSEEETEVAPDESADAVESRPIFQVQVKEEHPTMQLRTLRARTRRVPTRATVSSQSAALCGARVESASQADAQSDAQLEPQAAQSQPRTARSARLYPAAIAAQKGNTNSPSSSKRKGNERSPSNKRAKVSPGNAPCSQSIDDSYEQGQTHVSKRILYTPEPTFLIDGALRKRCSTANRHRTLAAQLRLTEAQARGALSDRRRDLNPHYKQRRKPGGHLRLQSTTSANLPPTPVSGGGIVRPSNDEDRTSSPQPSLGSSLNLASENDAENEDEALFQRITSDLQSTRKANLRSASRMQTPADTTASVEKPASSVPSVEPKPTAVRDSPQPRDPAIHEGTPDLQTDVSVEATDVRPVFTTPDRDIGLYQHGDPSVNDGNMNPTEPQLDPASPPSSLVTECLEPIPTAHQPSSTTRLSSNAERNERTRTIEHNQTNSRVGISIELPLMPASNVVTERILPGIDCASSLVSVSGPNPALARTQGPRPGRNVLLIPNLPSDNGVSGKPDQRLASPQKATRSGLRPFPPGTSSKPPRCSQCNHSLDRAIDVMKDMKGFAQWKTKCIYCRDRAGPRPSPCLCHTCQPPGAEEETDVVSADATPIPKQVDVLVTDQVHVLPNEQVDIPPNEQSRVPDSETTVQLQSVGIAANGIKTTSALTHDRVQETMDNGQGEASPVIDLEQWLHDGLDDAQEFPTDQVPHENVREAQLPLERSQSSDIPNVFVSNGKSVNSWDISVVHNEKLPRHVQGGSSNTLPPVTTLLANGLNYERRISGTRPYGSPITALAVAAQQARVDEYQPHIVPRSSHWPYSGPTMFHHPSLNWEVSRVDALTRMIYSLERVFDGSLTIDYMLDQMIPSVRREYAQVMAGVEQPNQTLSARPMKFLVENGDTLNELRTLSCLPDIIGNFVACEDSIKTTDRRAGVVSRLKELNQWFTCSVRSWGDADMLRLLALCHDLATLTCEMLRQEPHVPDPSILLGIMEVYDKEKRYLADAYGTGTGPTFHNPTTVSSTSQSTLKRGACPTRRTVQLSSPEWVVPRGESASMDSRDNDDGPRPVTVPHPNFNNQHIPGIQPLKRKVSLRDKGRAVEPNTAQHRIAPSWTTPNLRSSTSSSLESATACPTKSKPRDSICQYIKTLLDHSLTYDEILDGLIPKTQELCRIAKQRSGQTQRDMEHRIKTLNCWSTLLIRLRAEGYLHQRSPRNIPLKAMLEESRASVLPGLEKLKRIEVWYHNTVDMWRYKNDYQLMSLRRDILAIYKQLLKDELPLIKHRNNSPKGLEYVLDTYMLELSRTFNFHSYLTSFVEKCDPQLRYSYDPLTARELFPIIKPTAAQCCTAALQDLVNTPWLTQSR